MWTLRELKRALGHDAVGKDANLGRISIDSRTLKEGDIYLALKREKDGHDYIEAALDAGASYVISEKSYGYDDPQILMVSSTDKALSDLAEARRDWAYLQRIAVTGSVGKT
ncbi:MAG: Mur ligase domain-containing protein, partial [Alphaproteobacteria bacterium]|nr:Mur ligase domain-containing protein [Alphaproteobacteria bacterium]